MDEVDAGYADFLRAKGILLDWEANNVLEEQYEALQDEKDVELWKDTDRDKDILEAEELKLMYQLRYSKETNSTQNCYVTGGNTQSYLLGLGSNEENFEVTFSNAMATQTIIGEAKVSVQASSGI